MRAEGRPSGVAVASVIDSGTGTPAARASSNQAENCLSGSRSSSISSTAQTYGFARLRRVVATTRSIDIRTEIPGPRSREILDRLTHVVASPLAVNMPIVAEEARGALLTDVDGNTFVDFTGGVGVLNVGHA